MFKNIGTTVASLLVVSTALASDYADLAFHHAPIHYQDTDNSDYKQDYITAINYDNDWVSENNWDNFQNGEWPAVAYYSVVESCSHYFISYSFFHARDWSEIPFDPEHENDLEGVLMLVEKDNSTFGTLQAMVTVFHGHFYSYTQSNSGLTEGEESIDGQIYFENHQGVNRAKTAQEAKGHGIKTWPDIRNFTGQSNQDGIIYYPSRNSNDYPENGNDRFVTYGLVDIFSTNGLWFQALREAESPDYTFNKWGNFRGDKSGSCGAGWLTCSENSANTPWGWDDYNDGASYRGEFALDPGNLMNHYFNSQRPISEVYLVNRYLTDLRNLGFNNQHEPAGFPEQLSLNSMYQKLGSCS